MMRKGVYRTVLLLCLMLLLAGCSDKDIKIDTLLDKKNTKHVQMSVVDHPTENVENSNQIGQLFDIIEGLTVQRATKKEMMEVHNLTCSEEHQSIEIIFVSKGEEPIHQLTFLNDGRVILIDIEDGLGKDFYKNFEVPDPIYKKIMTFYTDQNESDTSGTNIVLDELEKKDGEHAKGIEVDLIRSCESR